MSVERSLPPCDCGRESYPGRSSGFYCVGCSNQFINCRCKPLPDSRAEQIRKALHA